MSKMSICRHEEFEAAHLLNGYQGGCGNLHGHTYKIEVTICGTMDPDNWGMVLDFNELKAIIKEILPDHKFMCDGNMISSEEDNPEKGIIEVLDKFGLEYVIYPFAPTAENLVGWFAMAINNRLLDISSDISVKEVKLWETTNSYAEWRC